MDRDKLAALTFALLMVGGAWWWLRRDQSAPADGFAAPEPSNLLGELPAAFNGLFVGVEDAAQSLADTVMDAVTTGAWSPPSRAAPYLEAIYAAEVAAGAPRNLFARQVQQESNFNPNAVNARSGAKGLGQFMDATWAEWGGGRDVFDPFANIEVMGRYMRWLHGRHGDWRLALAAYNWGTGNVQRNGLSAAPSETRNYVANIAWSIGLA